MTKLYRHQCEARAEALESAAGHLDLNWTDDPEERKQGDIVSKQLHSGARRWRSKARKAPEKMAAQPPLAERIKL